jgi:hypothetical protein
MNRSPKCHLLYWQDVVLKNENYSPLTLPSMAQFHSFTWFAIVGIGIFWGLAGCHAAPRQPGQRPLTAAEISQLRQELRQTVTRLPETIKNFPIYGDQRTPVEKQKILAFQQAWAKVNPSIAPFLGSRIMTNRMIIYPSKISGQVCVAYSWGDTAEGEGKFGDILSVGQLRNGQITTNNNEILFLEGQYLVMLVVGEDNKPSLWFSPVPTAEKLARPSSAEFELFDRQLQRLGCTADFPR